MVESKLRYSPMARQVRGVLPSVPIHPSAGTCRDRTRNGSDDQPPHVAVPSTKQTNKLSAQTKQKVTHIMATKPKAATKPKTLAVVKNIDVDEPVLTCPPRYGTARNLTRRTLGPKVVEYALTTLGIELMQWQVHVLNVALELDDKDEFVYSRVVVTLPRQSGKTTLILPWILWRLARFGGRQRAAFVAQDGTSGREKFIVDFLPVIRDSPLAKQVSIREANGSEGLTFKNGSHFGIKAPTRRAGHGSSLDLVALDEVFAHTDDTLEQSLLPTMKTRRSPQMILTSTAGDHKSTYLYAEVEAGRAACLAVEQSAVAYFEWSAASPAELGIVGTDAVHTYLGDPATWRQANPAFDVTINENRFAADWSIAQRTADGVANFMRTSLNIWVDPPTNTTSSGEWELFTSQQWDAATTQDPAGTPRQLTVGVAIVGDEWSLVGAQHVDNRRYLEHLATGRGLGAVLDELEALSWLNLKVVIDPNTAAGAIINELQRRAKDSGTLEVVKVARRAAMAACLALVDAITSETVAVFDTDATTNAARLATKKRSASDLWEIEPTATTVPLIAAALALAHIEKPFNPLSQVF
jgi:Phage Terminase